MTIAPRIRFPGTSFTMTQDGEWPFGTTGLHAFRYGSEVGLRFGDPASSNQGPSRTGLLIVDVVNVSTGQPVQSAIHFGEVTISFGQLLPFWWQGLKAQSKLLDTPLGHYVSDQLAIAALTPQQKQQLKDEATWGPEPDPYLPEAAGSGRVHAHLCPAGVALMLGADTAAMRQSGKTWVRSQGLRGCNVTWSPLEHPEWIVGHGYNTLSGGFSTLYSSVMPPGMASWPGTGTPPPHAQHMTIDATVWFALSYLSYSAAQTAVGQYLSVASFRMKGEHWGNSRAFGWFLKSTAYMAPLIKHLGGLVPHVTKEDVVTIAEKTLIDLEYSNWKGCPVVDSGIVSEGGHLDNWTVQQVALNEFGVGITAEQAQNFARSCNSWMTGILAEGLSNWLDLWDRYNWWPADLDLRRRALDQLRVCAEFMLNLAARPGYSMDAQGSGYIPTWGIHDDVAPVVPLVQGGDHPNTPVGVYARFLAGPCYAMARHLYADFPDLSAAIRGMVQPSLSQSVASEWWGSGPSFPRWVAEAGMEVVMVDGWAGVGHVNSSGQDAWGGVASGGSHGSGGG